MKFRQRLFWLLAFLSLAYVVGTFALAGDSAAEGEETRTETEQTFYEVGTGIGVGVVTMCGGALFFVFALMAWRNGVGVRNKRQHEETLAVQQQLAQQIASQQQAPPGEGSE